MANSYFQFKQFTVHQDRSAMRVTTDACLFGAWVAKKVGSLESEPDSYHVNSVLDIGTGTGLLSLMLTQKIRAPIDAIEIDHDAFEQAQQNIAASPWQTNVRSIHGDAKEFEFTKQYDMIISNPPFYEKELKGNDTKKNLAHHNEGLLLPELVDIIKKCLTPGGIFFLLLPYKRNEEIKKMLTEKKMAIEQLVFVRQTNNHDYFRIMLAGRSTGTATETLISEISIKDGEEYSSDFKLLLKDYYLHL